MRGAPEMARTRGDGSGAVLASAVLLAGGVAAAVATAAVRLAPPEAPAIATVRLAELTAQFATRAAGNGGSAHGARAWATALERALDLVAEREGVVLVPARAVAAGAPDLTAEVETALARLLGEAPPTEVGR